MKLGVVVVYLLREEDEGLLRLHLDLLRQYTAAPYRIYASTARLLPQFRRLLDQRPEVMCCDIPETDLRLSAEHTYYLKALLEAAIADGVTHLAILHVDTLPARPHWDTCCLQALQDGAAFVAMQRTENAEERVPHTAFIFLPTSFYREFGPIVSLPDRPSSDPGFERFRRDWGTHESGEPFGYWAYRAGLRWHRLLRTNAVDDHPVSGGLYGDLVFHLGGHILQGRWHRRDWSIVPSASRRQRLRQLIPRQLRRPLPTPLKRLLLPAEVAHAERNQDRFQLIKQRLLADPQAYFAYLRGEGCPPCV